MFFKNGFQSVRFGILFFVKAATDYHDYTLVFTLFIY